MDSSLLPQDCLKVMQRLFVFADTKDPQLNAKLNLIVNPQIIKILIKQVQDESTKVKIELYRRLSEIFQKNPFNSLILAKRDIEIMEFNHSILESIVHFVFQIGGEKQAVMELSEMIVPFVKLYPVNCKIVKNILSVLIQDFYHEKITHSVLKMSICLLRHIMKRQGQSQGEPCNYFITYGSEGGLKMMNRKVKWPFSKGFHVYLKLYIQNFTNQEMILWTLSLEQDDFILTISPEGELKAKIFSSGEVLTIGLLQKQKWSVVTLHYTIKSKILRNVFELICTIDNETYAKKDLPVPSISMAEEIVEMTLGHNFYGRIHSFALSRSQIIPGYILDQYRNKMTMNTWKQIESFLVINKKNLRDLFALYSPILRTTLSNKEIIYDISSQNHGQMLQNCGIHFDPFREVDMNYYGGLYTYLPFIHLLKFYEYEKYPEALTDIFELYLMFFENKFGNIEAEAINCAFLSILSQLVNELNPKFIKIQTMQIISRLNSLLTDSHLRREMLANFIFKLKLRKIEDTLVLNSIFQIIEGYYLECFDWTYNLINIDDIFHYLIDNFEEERSELCCRYHYSSSAKDKGEVEVKHFSNNYLKKTAIFSKIVKTIFISLPKTQSFRPLKSKIMELLFHDYSSCLKIFLLQTIVEGVKVDSKYFVEQFSILHYSYEYLSIVSLPEEMACLFQMLMNCQLYDYSNWTLRQHNISKISNNLDRIYLHQCQERGGQEDRVQNKRKTRRHSSVNNNLHVVEGVASNSRKTSALKTKILPIQINKNLYQTVIKLCFEFNSKQEEWLLKHDDYCLVLQPYFKLCCPEFKKNLINMIRNTVVIAFNGKKISSHSNNFDKLYKLLLTEFILKELGPADYQELSAADLNNDIIRNVYFIIDYTVINMREDWIHLYVYLLRLSGIMEEAKKEIAIKTERSEQNVAMAVNMANRKFVLRVVKLAQKNVFNMSNLIFLVSLVVFGNASQNSSPKIFTHFNSLEPYLLIGAENCHHQQPQNHSQKKAFLDSGLILEAVSSFKINEFDLINADSTQQTKIIQAFLDLEYTNEDSDLFENRFMYLIKAEFKQLKITDKPMKDLFGKEEGEKNNLSTGEIISTLICLCIEAGINTKDKELLEQSLKALLAFFQWFLLLSSRDGLKQEKHSERNIQLPRSIAASVLHFLYTIMSPIYPEQFTNLIEKTLYEIFLFLGLLIRCLSDKLGHPQNFQKALQKSLLLQNVQQYNFFTFHLLQQVLAMSDMTSLPTISRQKVLTLIHHPKVSGYFKNKLAFTIESKLQQAIANHHQNVADIRRQLSLLFQKTREIELNIKTLRPLEADFQKEFKAEHLKKSNLEYRKTQRIWIKIWKRLRLYHYYWSVSMNQKESIGLPFQKNPHLAYRHKFSKFLDGNGVRPVLEVEHLEPWHVKKMMMQKQFQYRSSNYLYHLHEEAQHKKKEKSFLQKITNSASQTIFFVDWIKHNSKRKGHLSVQNEKMKFKYLSTYQKDSHLEFASFVLAEYKPIQKYWPLVQITNIMERRYLTKRQCLLIEFEDGTSLIFNFLNEDKEEFMKLIEARQNKIEKSAIMKLNRIAFYSKKFNINSLEGLEEATQLWKSHRISNFRYLMLVNKYAGRSYLDPANYPVFPWILTSFDNETSEYRDLSKTVGALGNEERIQFYRNKIESTDPFDPVPPYQFGTHYSSPGVVFNFLIRLQPYTEASRALQGGKFDLSDRLFSSIKTCWKSVTGEVSDVRQLTPEFFYLPECLLNIDQHDFGLTQLKERVHNVQLPVWASSAYDFIVKHRIQLESDYTSEFIGNWIDLVFGYKQKGKLAQENLNLFYYLTYEDAIQLKNITDEQTRISKEAQIMHFGQTPSQLWTKPHGGRVASKKTSFSYKKISLIFSLDSSAPMSIIGLRNNKLVLFHDYNVIFCSQQNTYAIDREVRVLRNNSKQNIYFLEDVQFTKRVQIFYNQKYIAVASYINGDLLVFSLTEGKKVEEKKGSAKLCLHVNEKEDLMLVGSQNGLLEVYEIVYGEKDALTLVKIASEYYMAPIHSIREGGNFFSISSGSLVTLIRASRSLNYVYDKFKMRGVKMIRSLELPRKVEECLISTDPLFCLVVYTSLQLLCYSGNGQLLASKQAQLAFSPLKITQNFMDYLIYIENNRLKVLSLPFLKEISDIQLPNKRFVEMRFCENRLYLVTNFSEIITLEDHEQ